jgi:flagellar FliL protein
MEATVETTDAAAPNVATGSRRTVLIAAAAGLLVGAGVGGFIAGPAIVARFRGTSASAPAADGTHAAAKEGGGKEGKDGKDLKAGEGVLHIIDNLVLNPANSGGTRFLMLTATLDLKDAATDEEFKARDAEVRDLVLSYFGRRTVEQLTDMTQRDTIKKDILALLHPLFKPGSVKAVYFPQFVIQ